MNPLEVVYRKDSLLPCYENTLIYDIDLSVWVGGCWVGNLWLREGIKEVKDPRQGRKYSNNNTNILTFVIQKKSSIFLILGILLF